MQFHNLPVPLLAAVVSLCSPSSALPFLWKRTPSAEALPARPTYSVVPIDGSGGQGGDADSTLTVTVTGCDDYVDPDINSHVSYNHNVEAYHFIIQYPFDNFYTNPYTILSDYLNSILPDFNRNNDYDRVSVSYNINAGLKLDYKYIL
ncbi:hypothetical protein F5X98DRAFT_374802 [Xylaria grammica]|nr:hypothetical protein F5X98DRAFT_374802 [Xylaria grammica]